MDSVFVLQKDVNILVFTKNSAPITDALKKFVHGATLIKGTGIYTGEDTDIIIIVAQKGQLNYLKQLIQAIDQNAFLSTQATDADLGNYRRVFENWQRRGWSGALILTDDGDFIYKVTHPKHEITKTYTVTVRGIVEESEVQKLREGVIIDNDYTTKPADARIIKIDREKNQSRMEIRIHEGKNRQVRKMCEAIGRKVLALHRTKIGDVGVKDLKIGTWKYLTPNEVKSILKNN